ncbi:hypothetical protein [Cellulomonas hominis]|uniref:hypothetical protein n=1 Tax=Cellulomonas hominis TaxID=156981 RepID=UPI001BA313A5|nr:hypothetical protein [Cellulomonas hominis]VTR78624.1 hypothetical protein CHMI_03407 [Cellulomonas hominis]
MNDHDLHSALDALARRTAAEQSHLMRAGTGLSADGVASGARRHRRRRAAVATVAGLVVLGSAVVAGATVVDRPVPAPPASPAPSATSPAPTPSATPDGTVLPVGDPSLPFGACGSLADAPTDHPSDDRWTVALALDSSQVAVGDPLTLSTRLDVALPPEWTPNGAGYGAHPDAGPELLVLRDGVVVATGDSYGDVPSTLATYTVAAAAHSPLYAGRYPLTSCADGGALPAGTYQVVATTPVLPLGDDPAVMDEIAATSLEDVAAQHAGDWRRVTSAPQTLSVVARSTPLPAGTPPAFDSAALVPEPQCGVEVTYASAGPTLVLDVEPPASARSGEELAVPATLTYQGPGRLRAHLRIGIELWVVQDGVVVGGSREQYADVYELVDLGAGAVLDVAGGGDLVSCSEDVDARGEEPLPPGTYTAYPVLHVTGAELRESAGDVDLTAHDDTVGVTGRPFQLVVE